MRSTNSNTALVAIVTVFLGVAGAIRLTYQPDETSSPTPPTAAVARRAPVTLADPALWVNVFRRFFGKAHAGGFRAPEGKTVGAPECTRLADEAWERVSVADAFPNFELRDFNRTFRLLNDAFPSSVTSTLCHFTRTLGMDPAAKRWPARFERELAGKKVELVVEEARELWARDLGYRHRGELRIDGRLSLLLFWSGSGDASKGFLIEGVQGLFDEGPRHASYLQWDRTGSSQVLRYFGAEFESRYLESAAVPLVPSERPDRAVFGELLYDRYTGAIFLSSVVMEPQRGKLSSSGQFGCFRLFAKGTKGDAMLVARTADELAESGHARNTTFRDATEMDGAWLRDNAMTPADAGRLGPAEFRDLVEPAVAESPFAKSCQDLYAAGVNGGPFSGPDSDVDFTATPQEIFRPSSR